LISQAEARERLLGRHYTDLGPQPKSTTAYDPDKQLPPPPTMLPAPADDE
jgi:hypothetical protein